MSRDDSWTCIIHEKGPGLITDEVRAALTAAACELYPKKVSQHLFSTNVCSGIISCNWKYVAYLDRTGYIFRCQIDAELGEHFVNFLLSEHDLEYGAEIVEMMREGEYVVSAPPSTLSVEEFMHFYDLRGNVSTYAN
jgi:hypothetical protein